MSTFVVTVDKDAFLANVRAIVDLAPAIEASKSLKGIKYPDDFKPPALWLTVAKIKNFFSIVCAAIEVAKQQLVSTAVTPEGTEEVKFDKQIALQTAVKIITDTVKFGGWQGTILNKIGSPIINLIVSIFVSGKPTNWLDEARTILGLNKVEG